MRYGSPGNSLVPASSPNETVVFVVDLVAAYTKSVGESLDGTLVKSAAGGISVTGIERGTPTITIAKGTAKPTKESSTLLSRGTGAKVVPGTVVLQYVLVDWTGKVVQSTWKAGTPDGEVVGNPASKSAFDALVGMPLGSRVLFSLPATSSGGPYALVVEVAAEAPSGSSKS